MKISEIATHLGFSAAALADLMGVSKQALNNYTSGRKGKPSKFITQLLAVSSLNREEIIFPDRFDHPNGENPGHPAYWANVSIEAISEAVKRGLPESEAERIGEAIRSAISPTLDDTF